MDVERLQEALKGGAGACRGEAGGGEDWVEEAVSPR